MDYAYKVVPVVFAGAETDRELIIDGALIYYQAGALDVHIKLNSNSNDAIPLSVKQTIKAPFTKIYITSPGAGTVTLFMSKPESIKVEGMEVDVDVLRMVQDSRVDYYSTLLGRAFFGGQQSGGVAGQYSYLGLWNPAANAVNAVISEIAYGGAATSTYLAAHRHNAAVGALSAALGNKLLGGAAPLCELRYGAAAAIFGAQVNCFEKSSAAWGDPRRLRMRRFVVVPPGQGLYVFSPVVLTDILVNFDWLEVPV